MNFLCLKIGMFVSEKEKPTCFEVEFSAKKVPVLSVYYNLFTFK